MTRISKGQWLEEALNYLETDGVAAIKIDTLAKRLGVSRSGFYWHFKNRQDLLNELLDYWAHEYTSIIADNSEIFKLPPRERLQKIMMMLCEFDLAKYEIAMYTWAQTDAVAAKVVEQVETKRCEYLLDIFDDLGMSEDSKNIWWSILYSYNCWRPMMRHSQIKDRNTEIELLIATMLKSFQEST